ncbi:Uncharacterized protein OBRU01_16140, partial [Operophtera brumata]
MSGLGLRLLYLFNAQRAANAAGRERRRERLRNLRLRRCRAADAFSVMSDRDFIKTYRLTKPQMKDLIRELEPYIPKEKKRDGLDAACKVLIALAFFASGSYQTLVGQSVVHAVSQPTVSRAIQQVTTALNNETFYRKHVNFPLTREARERIRRRFYVKFGVPGVVGCVDGTHVCIIKPSVHEEAYYCRKGYHSLNVMIVSICDADLNILCVDPSSPGSTHDSTVWRDHPLNNHLNGVNESGETNFLLGDSGYALRKNLLTPILNADEGSPEEHYYGKHVRARNVVERTIGVLKARYRCLLVARQLHYMPEMAAKMVNACCVLHNIANRSRLQVPELSESERCDERRLQLQQRHEETALAPAAQAAAAVVAGPARRHNPPLAQGRA